MDSISGWSIPKSLNIGKNNSENMKTTKTVDKMIDHMENQMVLEIRLGRRPVQSDFNYRQIRITSCMSLTNALLVLTPKYECNADDVITAVCSEFCR